MLIMPWWAFLKRSYLSYHTVSFDTSVRLSWPRFWLQRCMRVRLFASLVFLLSLFLFDHIYLSPPNLLTYLQTNSKTTQQDCTIHKNLFSKFVHKCLPLCDKYMHRTYARVHIHIHTIYTHALTHTGSVGLSNVSIYRLFNVTWQVRIILLDINDNSPTILTNPSALLGTVGEDAAQDTFIISLEATDPDEGRNGTVIFSLTSGTRKVVLWTVRRDDEIIIIFFFFRERCCM